MKFTRSRRRWLAGITLLAILLFAAYIWLRPLLNIGSGYAAKHACSCHFLQGRELDEIQEHDLNFSVLGYTSLNQQGNSIHASFFGLVPREARYRAGVGCTLINAPGKALADVGADAGAKQVEGARVSNPPAFADALSFAMAPQEGGGTRGIVIMKNGEVIAEQYAEGYDHNTPLLGWSMTKTLTAMALGPALTAAGNNDANPSLAPAAAPQTLVSRKGLFPEVWTDSLRQQITIADLLHMNSGLLWNEAYGSLSDATIMLHEHADMAKYAYSAPAVEPRGTVWSYSSGTTNILCEIIDQEAPLASAHEFMHKLFRPIAPSLLIEPNQAGLPVGSSYGWATARDWARLGQFMLQDGIWQGDTLLPRGWIDYLLEPAAGSDGTYGGQTWLPGPDLPSIPADAYMMRGFQDQRVFIIPSRNLVIARLAHENDKVMNFDGLVEKILAADDIWHPKQGSPPPTTN